jgi:two-component system LytT family sensor kinase
MKIRWREHEAALITITTAILIGKYMYDMFRMSGLGLNKIAGILMPQIATAILLWLAYFWVNRTIIPTFANKKSRVQITWAVFQLFLVAYLIGPVINFASFYLHVDHQPASLQFAFGFGYHPQPLLNTFGGLGIASFFLGIYLLYAVVRETMIRKLGHEKEANSVAIVLVNETTLFLLRLFALPIFTSIFDLVSEPIYYRLYFACLLPTQAVFLTNKFFLFPVKGDKSFYDWQVLGPLTFFSFLYTIVFSPALGEHWSFLNVFLIYALQLFFVVPISWLDYKQEREKILNLRGIEKALALSKADLQLLRMQINPHFLFNVLNTIYGTALMEGAHRTAESTQKLGDMMRFMIHENTMDYIPVDQEIEYLRNYIDLQKIRIQQSPDIHIDDNIEIADSELRIVPMLLIPLVENAFKHGIDLAEKSFIQIRLSIMEGILHYEVSNSIHTLRSVDYERDHSGIGLKSVEQRLKMFYPGAHELSCGAQGNTFVSKLNINLNAVKKQEKCSVR